jgi:nucleoside-diphosphate-sugar epimerase
VRVQRLLIIGCGDIARRALPWLVRHYRVYAAVRSDARRRELRDLGVTPLRADLDSPHTLRRLAGIGNLILHFAPPQETGRIDKRTQALLAALSIGKILPRRLVYISTSGVYGDCYGTWASEERPVRPRTGRAVRRADAEARLRRFGRQHRVAVSILRAPGIYAGDRLPLARLERGLPLLQESEDIYTNHIHADDLAAIAQAALSRGRAGRLYNASDDSVLKMGEYFDLLADRFGLPRAPRLPRTEVEQRLSPAMLSFMEESRRLTNRRIKRELGVKLKYPEVASALADLLPEVA